MTRFTFIGGAIIFALLVNAALAVGGVPELMNYQGYLTDDADNPITGTVSIIFSFYSTPTGGDVIFADTLETVDVNDGFFATEVDWEGDPPLCEDMCTWPLYMGIAINGDPEIDPRTQLTSSPYSFVTNSLSGYDQNGLKESNMNAGAGDGFALLHGMASDESFPAESFFDVYASPDSGAAMKLAKEKTTGEKAKLEARVGIAPGVPNGYDDVVLRSEYVSALDDTSSFSLYTSEDSTGFRFYNSNGEYETDILEPIYHAFRMRAHYLSDYGDSSEFAIQADEFGAKFMLTDNHGDTTVNIDGSDGTIQTFGKVLASAYSSNSPLIFEAPVGSERARFDDISGNLGIGTIFPSAKLDVYGTTNGSEPLLKITHSTSSPADLYHTVFEIYNDSYSSPMLTIWGAGLIDQYSGTTVSTRINPSGDTYFNTVGGNVGIGVNNPSEKLDVGGQIRIRGGGPSANYVLTCIDGLGTAEWQPSTAGVDGDWDYTTSAPDMYSVPSGNVGIGTSSPTAKLHVEGTTYLDGVTSIAIGELIKAENDGGIRILGSQGNTAANPAIGFFTTGSTNDGGGGNGIFRPVANTIAIATGSVERLRIKSNGYVGIGTVNPVSILDINNGSGYGQLRLQSSYTPTGTSDSNGNTGDISWDDNFIYVKTSVGWKRSPLTSF